MGSTNLGANPETSSNEVQVGTNTDTSPPPEVAAADAGQSAAGGKRTSAKPGKWRDRNFNIFWAGQTLDALGDSAATIIIPLLVLEATGSVAQMGLVTGTMGVMSLVASLFSGLIVDRVDRRRLMMFCDFGRASIYIFIPLYWHFAGRTVLPIYLATVVTAFLTTNFIVAYTAVVPNIVDKDRINNANGRLQSTAAVSFVVGPMIAGLASSKLGAAAAVNLVSLSYIASGGMMVLVRLRSQQAPAEAEEKKVPEAKSPKLDELLAGMRFLLRNPLLRSVTLLFAAFIFVTDAAIDLSIYRLKNELHQDNQVLGIVFGVASLGSICAGMFAALLRSRWGFGASFLGSLALQAVAIAAIGLTSSVPIVAALATSFTFGLTIRNVCSMTLRQQVTPDHLMGRVTSAWWTIIFVMGPVGTAIATAVAQKLGTTPVLVVLGLCGLVVAAAGTLTPAHKSHPEDDETARVPLAVGAAET
jgi:MFS family permease